MRFIVLALTLATVACGAAPHEDDAPRRISAYSAEARTRGLVRVNNEAPPPVEHAVVPAEPPPISTTDGNTISMKNFARDAAEAKAANDATIAPCAVSREARIIAAWKERERYAAKLKAVRPYAAWIESHCIYRSERREAICGVNAPRGLTDEMALFALEYHAYGFPSIGSLGRYAAENESCEFADDQVGFDTQSDVGSAQLPPVKGK